MKVINSIEDIKWYMNHDNENNVFRGYVNNSQLIPTLGRYNLGEYEHQLLREFVGLSVFKNKLTISTLSQVIELAQHYGIPTRFLDWSYDIKVALYFALERHKEDDEPAFIGIINTDNIAVLGNFTTQLIDLDSLTLGELDEYSLGEVSTLSIHNEGAICHIKEGRFTLYDLFIDKLNEYHLNQSVSLAENKRIVEQKGCFTTSRDIIGMISPDVVLKLEFTSDQKKEVLEYINVIRKENNEPNFFPDLSGVYLELEEGCKRIMDKYQV